MNILDILKYVAAGGTALTGIVAFIMPTAAYSITGLRSEGNRGLSDIRAVMGGLFIALGIAPFLLGDSVFQVLGFGYAGVALARIAAIFLDRTPTKSNLGNLAVELVFAVILLLRG